MNLTLLNESEVRMPKKFLMWWHKELCKLLKQRLKINVAEKQLTILFLNLNAAQKLNQQYRQRSYATDVLSFDGDGETELGDLVLCPQVVKRQALEHDLHVWEELGYCVLHGVLHLLGYDHEGSKKAAKEMFALQDELFELLCTAYEKQR